MTSFDVESFLSSLQETKPPWECPKCQKLYKTFQGIEHHLHNYDHTLQTPNQQKLTPLSSTRRSRMKFSKRRKNCRFMRRSPSPLEFHTPTRDTLTWAEAQRMVEVESEGKIYRLNISDKLDIISDSDVDRDDESSSATVKITADTASSNILDSEKSGATDTTCKSSPVINRKDLKNVTLASSQYYNESLNPTLRGSSSPVKLPKPTFRVLPEYEKETPDAPARTCSYYRYIERPSDELEEEVEYDMDEEDQVWLELMNEERKKDGLSQVTPDQLELLMDRFEKESYFEQSKHGSNTAGNQPLIDEDAVCCVCNDGECQNSNVILFCDMCNLAVHQECYGVPYIPEGQWLCRRCLQSPSCPVDCCLCPSRSGAFKQTDDGKWAHVICALWVPEVGFSNTVFLEPIDSLKKIPPARWRLTCYVCKQRNIGACIQCHRTNCYTAFHVTCAQQAGLYMKMEPVRKATRNGMTITIRKEAFCDVHTPPDASPRQKRFNGQLSQSPESKSPDKLKKNRKILVEKRHEAPHIAIPHIPKDKMSSIGVHVNVTKKNAFLQRLLSYWTLKRQARNGVPLLRRLQSHTPANRAHSAELASQQSVVLDQLKYWHRLRHDLEHARLLIEQLRKREKLKRETIRVLQAASELRLTPLLVMFRRALAKLRNIDMAKVFAEPVSAKEAPDYSKIIKTPMDLRTMEDKIEAHAYKTTSDLEEDFNLIVDNCMLYNPRDSVFYSLALKMRDRGGAVIRALRREVNRNGIDFENGMLLPKTPKPTEQHRLMDEAERAKLPLSEQLNILLDKLDLALEQSKKTKKIRCEIQQIRRKMFNKGREQTSVTEPASTSSSSRKTNGVANKNPSKVAPTPAAGAPPSTMRRFSADDVANAAPPPTGGAETTTTENDDEAVNSDVDRRSNGKSPRKMLSAKARNSLGRSRRKRLWGGDASADNRKNLSRSKSCPGRGTNGEGVEGSDDEQIDLSAPSLDVSDNAALTVNGTRKVGRRTTVLFQKKSRDSIAVDKQPSTVTVAGVHSDDAAPVAVEQAPRSAATDDATTLSLAGCKRRLAVSITDLAVAKRKRQSSSSERGEYTNGFGTVSADDCAFGGSKSFKRHNSVQLSSRRVKRYAIPAMDDDDSSDANDERVLPRKRSLLKKRSKSCNQISDESEDIQPGLTLADAQSEEHRKSNDLSTTEDECDDDEDDMLKVDPLDLVWAKCRGYPPYPALVIDPCMPRNGYCHNGVPIPVPPLDVLHVGDRRIENGNRNLYLVLFFDAKRTWQWLPRNKLEPLGGDKSRDKARLGEGRRPTVRRNVEAAYQRALSHRSRVTGDLPDDSDGEADKFAEKR